VNITSAGLRRVLDVWGWADDSSAPMVLLVLSGVMILAFLLLYVPLTVRWIRTAGLDHKLRALTQHAPETPERSVDAWTRVFQGSPAEFQWNELHNRWLAPRSAVEEVTAQSPTSLATILDRWPLLPGGLRRTFLDSLPGLFVLMGMAGALFSLSAAVSMHAERQSALSITDLAAIGLGPALWGLSLAVLTSVASRLFHGVFEHYSESIDRNASEAFADFCAENPIKVEVELAASPPPLNQTTSPVTEVEATHIAHLQLNNVTRQMSSLIEHLHESGFALRNAASALRSTQSRIENNSEEIRISLKQAASTIVDQGGFIQMSLDQIRKTLGESAARKPSVQVPAQAPPVKDLALQAATPISSKNPTSISGRRLGPDPYARKEAEEQSDSRTAQRLLEQHELEASPESKKAPMRSESSKAASGKLSDLLASPHDSAKSRFPQSRKTVDTRERGSSETKISSAGDGAGIPRAVTRTD
jgi:hypothetical protein